MSTTEVIDVSAIKEQAASDIDTARLTDQEKILLNTHQEDAETITNEWEPPAYLQRLSDSIPKVIHTIFPDATTEQLNQVAEAITKPLVGTLVDIAYYNHAASHKCIEQVRKEHVLQPPTRYTLDFSITAIDAILNGVFPGYFEEICLKNAGQNISDWRRDIPEPNQIPETGIPAKFVVYNQIYTGKLCFFSYLSENGDSHVITDILTFWSNELNGFVHTFRVGYWQEINPLTGEVVNPSLTVDPVIPEVDNNDQAIS